jgi:hypothetical protein
MTGRPGHSPVRSDPSADCVVGRSPGFLRYRSGESKWTGLHVHQHVQIADRSLVRAYQPEQRCSPGTEREFRTHALRKCAILWGLLATLRVCVIVQQRSEYNYYSGKGSREH